MEGTECQSMWLRTKTQKCVTVNSMFNVFEVAIFVYRTNINIEQFAKDFIKSYGGQAVWGAICKKNLA